MPTVKVACTVPSPVRWIGTSRREAVATLTGTAGGLPRDASAGMTPRRSRCVPIPIATASRHAVTITLRGRQSRLALVGEETTGAYPFLQRTETRHLACCHLSGTLPPDELPMKSAHDGVRVPMAALASVIEFRLDLGSGSPYIPRARKCRKMS